MESLQHIKQRFGIIGNDQSLMEPSKQLVSGTEITVLVTGEIGVGKKTFENYSQFSPRKHAKYIAVNCGAIPEGTIDSELWS